MNKKLYIGGMKCSHCADSVKKSLSFVSGVEECKIDLSSGTAELSMKKDVSEEVLKKAVEDAGF